MIVTFLEPDPAGLPAGSGIAMARPKTLALVRIPRFHPALGRWPWTMANVVNFLIDTGADTTSIDLANAVDLFEPRRFSEIRRTEAATGIGNHRVEYAIEPAELYLLHDDGKATLVRLDIGIEKPPPEMIAANKVDDSLLLAGQALLGRDVLAHLKLDMDYKNPDPYVRLWPKGTNMIEVVQKRRRILRTPPS